MSTEVATTHKDPFNLGWKDDLGKPDLVRLVRMDVKRMDMLKILHHATFPVRYPPKFYDQLYQQGHEYSWLADYKDALVGAICCRFEKQHDNRVYIMTLGVLEPYRRLGIASHLLRTAMLEAYEAPHVHSMALHVQTSNEPAIAFYKAMGFEIVDTIENYYTTLKEDAHLLSKDMKNE